MVGLLSAISKIKAERHQESREGGVTRRETSLWLDLLSRSPGDLGASVAGITVTDDATHN